MKVPVPDELLAAEELGSVHFVGIGGAGLSAIARIMLARGITVSGSDAADSPGLRALVELGATCWVGHAAAHVAGADTVVVSTAVHEDNPEVIAARAAGLRLWPRSAAMQSILQGRRVIAVAGTHGKTTTTSLMTVALQHCGADPSYTIGGQLNSSGVNAGEGGGDLFVAESDESDGAFLVYSPYAAVVTNVEADHLDNWGTPEAYHAGFERFIERIVPGGFLVACIDDPGARALAGTARAQGIETITVGLAADADVRVGDLEFAGSRSSFTVSRGGHELGRVDLRIPGRHYVLDAAAALATGLRLGFDFAPFAEGLGAFTGTHRRMEFKGESRGVRVYDSYAHHPNEIAGDLQAGRVLAGAGRLIVAFQPHLVSRTRIFAAQMGAALSAADEVVVLDVYVAREDPDPEVSGALVAAHVDLPGERVHYVPDWAEVAGTLAGLAGPGDLVLTLGAGDVTRIGPLVLGVLDGLAKDS